MLDAPSRAPFNGLVIRRFLVLAVLFLSLGSLVAEQRLNLFIWSEYIDPQVVADFEKKFDCKVTIDLYEDAESMLAKVQGGGASLYDVVVPPDHIVPAMVKLNLLSPLRHEQIPNLKNLDEKFANPPYDRGNKFTAAYQWGTVGILVRKNDKAKVDSWNILFDSKRELGSFVLIDSMRDMIGAALKYKGYSLNSTDPKQLKEARDLVIDAKKRALSFDGSVGGKNKVLGKNAAAAIVYSGEGVRAMTEDPGVVYFIPKEGSQIWVDNIAVLAKAPNRDLAEKFVNYILEPEVGAKISNFTSFASPNKASTKFIKPEDLKNPAIYPDESTKAKLEFLTDLGGKSRIYDEVWTQIKAK